IFVALMTSPLVAQTERGRVTDSGLPTGQQGSPPPASDQGETQDPQVSSAKDGDADEQKDVPPHRRSGDHMFGVLPNYSTVEDPTDVAPIGPGAKFKMASQNTFDPYVYPFVGFVATLNHTYGSGASGYLKQYAASLTDNSVGNVLTTAVLPSVLHQDPRYF